ncbi:hypothetical protein [Escherichia phage vB_EcoP_EP32B]|nr:hypothetical protein [Escherichia phage vB_EcoP_EP32B]
MISLDSKKVVLTLKVNAICMLKLLMAFVLIKQIKLIGIISRC